MVLTLACELLNYAVLIHHVWDVIWPEHACTESLESFRSLAACRPTTERASPTPLHVRSHSRVLVPLPCVARRMRKASLTHSLACTESLESSRSLAVCRPTNEKGFTHSLPCMYGVTGEFSYPCRVSPNDRKSFTHSHACTESLKSSRTLAAPPPPPLPQGQKELHPLLSLYQKNKKCQWLSLTFVMW